jgi:hypothetical protein
MVRIAGGRYDMLRCCRHRSGSAGMAAACLFLTPTMIAGDRSLVDLAHVNWHVPVGNRDQCDLEALVGSMKVSHHLRQPAF